MHYVYHTRNTCSTSIEFDLADSIVTNIVFQRGCDGNLKAISKLVDGCKAQDIIAKLKGNTCGMRTSSCADQLSIALEQALLSEQQKQNSAVQPVSL